MTALKLTRRPAPEPGGQLLLRHVRHAQPQHRRHHRLKAVEGELDLSLHEAPQVEDDAACVCGWG